MASSPKVLDFQQPKSYSRASDREGAPQTAGLHLPSPVRSSLHLQHYTGETEHPIPARLKQLLYNVGEGTLVTRSIHVVWKPIIAGNEPG